MKYYCKKRIKIPNHRVNAYKKFETNTYQQFNHLAVNNLNLFWVKNVLSLRQKRYGNANNLTSQVF